MDRWYLRRETLFLFAVAALAVTTLLAIWAMQPTRLRIAVGPPGSGEVRIVQAIARSFAAKKADLRLTVLTTRDMRASAFALQDGQVDLAIVRPDVLLPSDSASIAVLHDQALLIVAPAAAKLDSIAKLGGKRLGMAEQDAADLALLPRVLGYYGLHLGQEIAPTPPFSHETSVLRLLPTQISAALAAGRVDAVATVVAPNSAEAREFVSDVQRAVPDAKIAFVSGVDGDGITTRLPDLKPVTIPAGAFAGGPPVPAAEVKTIGTPYLVMARVGLGRGTVSELTRLIFTLRPDYGARLPETSAIRAPDFENSAAATTAHVPVHPGALDYLNREQRGFMERYGDFLYLGGLLFGLIGSGIAWIRERVARLHREYVDDVLDRLAAIAKLVQASESRQKLDALTSEIDQLAIDVVRDLRDRGSGTAALSAVDIVLDAARSRVGGRREALARLEAQRMG